MTDLIHGRVEQLLPGGESLVRTNDGVLLAANGVPGDALELESSGRRRGAERGRIVRVAEASPLRVGAVCSVAAECGACAMQYVNAAAQPGIKSDWVHRAFESFLQADTEWIPVGEAPLLGMRRRARWHRGSDAQGSFLGFHSRSSHKVVRAAVCAVVHPAMDALRQNIEALLPSFVESVRMLKLQDGMHVVFEAEEGVDATADALAPCVEVMQGVYNPAQTQAVQPWLRAGFVLRPLSRPVHTLHDRLPAGEAWVELTVGPEDFVQGHAAGNESLLRQIQAWAGKPRHDGYVRRIADLFCGIGNLSLPLAALSGATVQGADVAESSTRQARLNASALGIEATFEVTNLFAEIQAEQYAGADVLLLDPPRKGARAICKSMGKLLPGKIIMVNCDIAAGARDAALLAAHGYRLRALRALDIFPFSGHVEAMSCWVR